MRIGGKRRELCGGDGYGCRAEETAAIDSIVVDIRDASWILKRRYKCKLFTLIAKQACKIAER